MTNNDPGVSDTSKEIEMWPTDKVIILALATMVWYLIRSVVVLFLTAPSLYFINRKTLQKQNKAKLHNI